MIENYPYDVAVAYRVYPKVSGPSLGLPFSDDKLQFAEVCLRSFIESVRPLRVKVWAILDGCPCEYEALFRRYVAENDLIIVNEDKIGNRATFGRQIDVLISQSDAPFVYFAEDDYLYHPGQFAAMVEFMNTTADVDFITAYDHPDCYRLSLHDKADHIRVAFGRHWRTTASTCLTFLARKSALQEYEQVFRSFTRKNEDCSLWLALTKARVFNPLAFATFLLKGESFWKLIVKSWLYSGRQILFGRKTQLWCPLPGIATHLDVRGMAPNYDWRELMERTGEELCGAMQQR